MKQALISAQTLTRIAHSRRSFLRDLAAGLAVVAPVVGTAACGSKKLTCTDTSALAPEEQQQRTTLAYAEKATDPAKKCSSCSLFKPAAPDQCGSCTVVKGPINPEGGCLSWVQKT